MSIVDLVKKHGPISRADLAQCLKTTERKIAAEIHDLNLAKVPIVFTGKGFIYARKRSEIQPWARNQKNAAFAMLRKVAAVTKSDLEGVVRELI